MTHQINLELLEKTLRADGWTMNATDYIIEAVRVREQNKEFIELWPESPNKSKGDQHGSKN